MLSEIPERYKIRARDGRVVAPVVLECSFYWRSWLPEDRVIIAEACRRALDLVAPRVSHMVVGSSTRSRKISSRHVDGFLHGVRSGPPYEPCYFSILSDGPEGEADGWGFTFHYDPIRVFQSPTWAGTLLVSMPVIQQDAPAYEEFRSLFSDLANTLPAESGLGGLAAGFNRWHLSEVVDQAIATRLVRCIGLNYNDLSSDMGWMGAYIKGISWLTFVGEKFLKQLGGLTALRQELADEIACQPLGSGAMIQIGDVPRLGDVNRYEDMASYRTVNRVLRPLRLDPRDMLRRSPGALVAGLSAEQTCLWYERFDGHDAER